MEVFIVVKTNKHNTRQDINWNVEAVYEDREDAYNFLKSSSKEYAQSCTVIKRLVIKKK